jgi:hypothetical protein
MFFKIFASLYLMSFVKSETNLKNFTLILLCSTKPELYNSVAVLYEI